MKFFWYILTIVFTLYIFNNIFNIVAINFYFPSNESTFRLMTYNTNGVNGSYENEAFVNGFLESIDYFSPQVLVLQEMYTNYTPSLCDSLKKRYSYSSLSEKTISKSDNKAVACIFSKYPIKKIFCMEYNKQELDSVCDIFNIPTKLRRFMQSDVYNAILDLNGQETLVVCCYLKTNDYSRLRHIHSDSWLNGLNDYFNGYNIGSAIRSLDAKMIRDSIDQYDLPTIVCGDMNDFQFSRSVKTIMGDDLKNMWWERGLGYGMTYNKYNLKIRIDHILLSREYDAVSVDIPHLRFSDHYPIVADLKYVGKN